MAVSSNTIQALEEREWIRVVGHRDVPGKPALFGTTKIFLDYFGLKRLEDLPPLSELKDIGELEPQLFDTDIPVPAGIPLPEPAEDQATVDESESDAATNLETQHVENPAEDLQDSSLEDISTEEHDDTESVHTDSQASSEQKQ